MVEYRHVTVPVRGGKFSVQMMEGGAVEQGGEDVIRRGTHRPRVEEREPVLQADVFTIDVSQDLVKLTTVTQHDALGLAG